jgi:hypothetical protein
MSKKTEGLDLNGTHRLLVCADDVNLLDEDINIINTITKALVDASKEVGLAEKGKDIFISRHQTAGKHDYIKVSNNTFGNVAEFCLGTTVTNQNYIHK